MRSFCLSLIIIFFSLSGFSQDDKVVMTVDGKEVTVGEFKNIYEKNNDNPSYKKEDIDEYLSLFKNFKIVVAEALDQKYDTIPRLQRELKGYRDQLARPYLIDKEKTEELIKEAYERMKTEVHASHILVRVQPNASPEDTLKAYNKIKMIKAAIEKGGDFADHAKGKSEDPSARTNGGDLGYFTSLQMVYPFENAAYNTKEGKVSDIIRTRFGYHILKVHDKRPARGKMEAAHIMIAFSKNPNEEEIQNAEKKINELYDKLENGEDFFTLATQYSDDVTTKKRGGRLPFFGTGTTQRMLPEFEDAAFSIEENGQYSKPFKTDYGYHIVYRVNLEPLQSFEDMESQIRSRVNKDSRSQLTRSSFITKLKDEYNFKENKKNVYKLIPLIDSSYFTGKWKVEPNEAKYKKEIFSFANQKYTQNDFLKYLIKAQREQKPQPIKPMIDQLYKHYSENEVFGYEQSHLEEKYPEFNYLMQEYKDGVLLFEIKQDMVWNKALKDTTGLKEFYEAHKKDYMWPERLDVNIFDCKDKNTAKDVIKNLKKEVPVDTIVKTMNESSQLNVKHTHAKLATDDGELNVLENKSPGLYGPYKVNGKYFVYRVNEKLDPAPKKLDEARGIVTSDYQKELEQKWMQELRKKHKVEVNEEVLYNIEN